MHPLNNQHSARRQQTATSKKTDSTNIFRSLLFHNNCDDYSRIKPQNQNHPSSKPSSLTPVNVSNWRNGGVYRRTLQNLGQREYTFYTSIAFLLECQ
mmetsp:Transcript_19615/g.41109  ORF Transcript_19615/g.41109 Transcript_19615/m.41109 type:complete len:97 (+) Transcript_19615:481-771(+)